MTRNEVAGNRLHEVMTMWSKGIMSAKNGYLLMGRSIYLIKQEALWKLDMENCPTFKYWVEHTLHISIAQAHRLAQIHEECGTILIDLPIDISKVTLMLPYLKGKTEEEKKDMLVMANDCTVEDIKNNLLEASGQPEKATDVCSHTDVTIWRRCNFCGKFIR